MVPSGRRALASPIRKSLALPILMWGVSRRAAILNFTITGALVQSTKNLWLLAIGVALHYGAYKLTKRDPYWIEKFLRYWRTARYYDA